MTLRQRLVWKRTWWSLYNHARLTSEDLLTMMTIEGDHHVSEAPQLGMITLCDFQFEILPPDVRAVADDCEVLRSLDKQTIQAILFVEKTKLCCLSQFSSFSNSVKNLLLTPDKPSIHVCPKPGDIFGKRSLEELEDWYDQLPYAAQHSFPITLAPTPWERSIYLHRAWLKLLYLGTSYATLWEDMRGIPDSVDPRFMSEYLARLHKYLAEVTDLFEEIYSLEIAELLPGPAVALLVLALAYNRQLRDSDTLKARKGALKVHQCWNIMRQLRGVSVLARGMDCLLNDRASDDQWHRLNSFLLIP